MEEIRSIVSRYPQRELEIRRLCSRDAGFQSVCRDYDQATSALHFWQQAEPASGPKTEHYRDFLEELETEILAKLDQAISDHRDAHSRGL